MATKPYDTARYLDSEEMVQAYLAEVFEQGDVKSMIAALGTVARARSMSELAAKINLSRESLYRSLSPEGNPSFSTVMKVVDAFGMHLTLQPHSCGERKREPRSGVQ